MPSRQVTVTLAPGRTITIETGKYARLAGGAVTVTQGETVLLVAACSAKPRPDIDFFPLQVDYREKFSAAGRFPGGYFKREGRPSEKEILTCRLIDRPLRPLFPEGYFDDLQVMALLLCADGENEADVLGIVGASAALMLSDIPFQGPVGGVRVGRVNGQFVLNPTHAEMATSDLDLVYAGMPDKVIMIEGGGDEISEEVLRDALVFANEAIKALVAAQLELTAVAGRPKKTPNLLVVPPALRDAIVGACGRRLRDLCLIASKEQRYAALDALFETIKGELAGQYDFSDPQTARYAKEAYTAETRRQIRRLILDEGRRSDGRPLDQVRPLSAEVGLLPRVHGSGLFERGETQVLAIPTLGPEKESQNTDAITGGSDSKKFFLHYNFPNFSVGETGRISGPGRREIGHGALAERSLARLMPKDFPYAVRIVSEVMASNGSTSMASVCAGSLALFDAGVPLPRAVAGISCGLVVEDGRTCLLTDIIGAEDHYGDMDFKVAGSAQGITGFQLDLKIAGISIDLLYQAMLRNKTARMQILDAMNACLPAPRPELSPYAPRVAVVKINTEKIGALIGPGGKVIRELCDRFKVQIDVEEDGTVRIYSANGETMAAAVREVESIAAEVVVGKIYRGVVKTVREFGAFVEILPGQDGLLHISEMADYRVKRVEDICVEGDTVTVKVIDVDDRGRIRLSRKAALADVKE